MSEARPPERTRLARGPPTRPGSRDARVALSRRLLASSACAREQRLDWWERLEHIDADVARAVPACQAELDQLFASKLFRKTSCATATARRRRATRSRPATAAAEAADDGADASAALDAARPWSGELGVLIDGAQSEAACAGPAHAPARLLARLVEGSAAALGLSLIHI